MNHGCVLSLHMANALELFDLAKEIFLSRLRTAAPTYAARFHRACRPGKALSSSGQNVLADAGRCPDRR
jgi:hypothetical protein